MSADLDPAVGELLAAVVALDERTRSDSDAARSDALAFVGGVVRAVAAHEVQPGIAVAVLRAWRPGPHQRPTAGGVLVTRPMDWPRDRN